MPELQNSSDTRLRVTYYDPSTEAINANLANVTWYELDANDFGNFGAELGTVTRQPISAGRKPRRSKVADLDASAAFPVDVTTRNMSRLLESTLFTTAREKDTTRSLDGDTDITITAVDGTGNDYEAAAGLDAFAAGQLVKASGFSNASNNGLKTVVTAAAASLTVSETVVDEPAPPAAAKIEVVGFVFGTGELIVDVASGDLPRLTIDSGTADFSTMGLIPGEWLFIGGDATGNRFTNAVNNGWARIKTVDAAYLEIDKKSTDMVADTAATEDIQLFFGTVIRDEAPDSALTVNRFLEFERELGEDDNGAQSEYLVKALPDTMTINVPTSDKVTADFSFIAADHATRDGTTGTKSSAGTLVAVDSAEDFFNTSTDVPRHRLSTIDPSTENPERLFTFVTDLSIEIGNSVNAAKAVGALGAIDLSPGDFTVAVNLSAYFSTVDAIEQIRNSSDCTFDTVFYVANEALVIDVPLIRLSQDGGLDLARNEKMQLPLSSAAAENDNGYVVMFGLFPYVPAIAQTTA